MNTDLQFFSCLSGCRVGDFFYFIDISMHVLIRFNLKNYSYELLSYFPSLGTIGMYATRGSYHYKNSLYFLYQHSRNILCYDLESRSCKQYGNFKEDYSRALCMGGCIFENKIISIPQLDRDPIEIFNLDRNSFTELYIKDFLPYIIEDQKPRKIICGDRLENSLYFALFRTSYVLELDIVNQKIKAHNLGNNICIDSFSVGKEGCYFLDCEDKKIKLWNKKNGISDIWKTDFSLCDKTWRIKNIIDLDEDIVAIPTHTERNGLQIFSKKQRTIKKVMIRNCENEFRKNGAFFGAYEVFENKIILFPYATNKLIILDTDSWLIESHEFNMLSEDSVKCRMMEAFELKKIQSENSRSSLNAFLEILIDEEWQ